MNRKEALLMEAEEVRRSPFGFFIRNPRISILVLLSVIMGGTFGLFSMPLESDPEVKIPIGIVVTPFPGASPTDTEKLVTDILEEDIKGLDNIDKLTSSSIEGISTIVVEFDPSADIDESIRDLRDEVEISKVDLPEAAEDPVIRKVEAGDSPIVAISIVGEISKEEFKFYAEELEDILEDVKGVDRVDILGIEETQMQVLISREKLEGLELSVLDVTRAIRDAHIDLPIGSVRTGNYYYQATIRGQFETEQQLMELVVANRESRNIFLRDIAEIREVFGESSSETRIFRNDTGEYSETVTLQMFKKTGEDLVDIVDRAKVLLEDFQESVLPPGVEVIVTSDVSDFIREDIRRLSTSAVQTILIIGLILFIAVGRREAIVTSISIPLIFLMAFFGLYIVGETFNFIVLFSLILSLGILVDTSIVIMEGIHDNVSRHKLGSEDAALASVGTYKAPLIAGTLTTISAFVPMSLMSGIMGEYVSHIPITLNITLLSSLFVALTLVPTIAVWVRNGKKNHEDKPPLLRKIVVPLRRWYSEKIRKILQSKRERRLWVGGMIVAFFVAFSLPFIGVLKVQMFPGDVANFFFVTVEAPPGTILEETKRITRTVETMVEELPEMEYFISAYGGDPVGVLGHEVSATTAGTNVANITVNLKSKEERKMTSIEIASMLREQVKSVTEADITIVELQSGPPTGAPVEVRLIGEDVIALEKFASIVERELKEVEGAKDIAAQVSLGTGEYHLKPRRDRMEYFGVSAVQLAQLLRSSVFGDDSVEILESGEEIPILVRLDYRETSCTSDVLTSIREKQDNITICRSNPKDIAEILNLLIPTSRGMVPMSELVAVELQPAITTIRHLDTDTLVSVTAYVEERFVVSDIIEDMQVRMEEVDTPEGISIVYGGETEDTTESFQSLWRAMIVGIILIAVILVYQFNSFAQPFIILFTIPLAVIGVFPGLAILGRNFSFPGFIGFVALSGIVVNDAIVLIDMINKNVRSGMKVIDAICNACEERLQPIILTTVTTALGMLPLVFASAVFGDLAIVVSIGIVFATVLTLLVVPIFYMAVEGRAERKREARENA